MKIKTILENVKHRHWKIPDRKWNYYQEWNNVVFLHYEVDLCELEELVPKDIEIDLFNGKPWVSIVAFTMEKIRLRNLPSVPPICNFDEVNIRTYVRVNGKSGVYFLSIEGGKRLSCFIAKGISGLPYKYAKLKRSENQYFSNNNLKVNYLVGEKITSKSEIDIWLSERYALFQEFPTSIYQYDIHHMEWSLNELLVNDLEVNYPKFEKLFRKTRPDLIAYSSGVKVLAWDSVKYRRVLE